MSKQFDTTESFITKAIQKHSGKYDYSKVVYVNSTTKVEINCPVHGLFLQAPNSHLQGYGCSKCGRERTQSINDANRSTPRQFLTKCMALYGDRYDYSQTEYVARSKHITVRCREHGAFTVKAGNHVDGTAGCRHCKYQKISAKHSLGLSAFVEKAKSVHGDRYDYSKVEYKNNSTNVNIVCPYHGDFLQRPADHISKKTGCPECKKLALPGKYTLQAAQMDSNQRCPAILYLIELKLANGKVCTKVGITVNSVRDRFANVQASTFDIVNIKEFNTTLSEAIKCEHHVLKEFERFEVPLGLRFAGHTECLQPNKDIEERITRFLFGEHNG